MSSDLQSRAAALFAEHYAHAPTAVEFAPGRVNLIGEHVDYNDGLVLPMPVQEGTAVAWSLGETDEAEIMAADFGEVDRFNTRQPKRPAEIGWQSYVRGMIANSGPAPAGLKMLVTGNLPRGSGLSSSASLCIAIGRAVNAAAGRNSDVVMLAKAAQRTEHEWAGVECGIMDQMAVAGGKTGHAMLLDCRDLSFELIPIPESWSVAVTDSGVTRGLVDGEYNQRRAQCEAAARALGVSSLRDANIADLEAADLPEPTNRRAMHVISEIARTGQAAAALRQADLARLGTLLAQGHASLRDLFDVSVPAVDAIVEELDRAISGAGSARMTGAGFGGSIVAVVERDELAALALATGRKFRLAC